LALVSVDCAMRQTASASHQLDGRLSTGSARVNVRGASIVNEDPRPSVCTGLDIVWHTKKMTPQTSGILNDRQTPGYAMKTLWR
jgi:hypothetical protein